MKKKLITLLMAALLTQTVSQAAPAFTCAVSADESPDSEIFRILTEDGGFNSAAACGILGNLEQECGLDPNNSTGSFYGLVQWDGARTSALRTWCAANSYDSSSIEGQTYFMIHELENSYPEVFDALMNVEDSVEGAYSAACTFCSGYEQCGNYDWEYGTRGGFATTFFDSYGGLTADTEEDEYASADEAEASDEYVNADAEAEESMASSEETAAMDAEMYGIDNEVAEAEPFANNSSYEEDLAEEQEENPGTADEEASPAGTDNAEATDGESSNDGSADGEAGDYDGRDDYVDADGADGEASGDEESGEYEYDEDGPYSEDVYRELLSGSYDMSLIFDYDYYTTHYPEALQETGSSEYDAVLYNFLTVGVTQGRRASLDFSVLNYQQNYEDLCEEYEDEYPYYYLHYLEYGYDLGYSGEVSEEQYAREQEERRAEAEWQEYLASQGSDSDEEDYPSADDEYDSDLT